MQASFTTLNFLVSGSARNEPKAARTYSADDLLNSCVHRPERNTDSSSNSPLGYSAYGHGTIKGGTADS